ncbi:37S ribosomal protein S28, mitochondrial [Vanrija pseudolonga]|uniref:37S ribosomal protein S28, mitochondrial n=1 Tax=Vanrija pseudolonga TaxID=143232 RepID=A0AAF0YCN2_9TREE|nr:37S ribosomal protein S28, mitochondrial [Vanrija pseudolonga]
MSLSSLSGVRSRVTGLISSVAGPSRLFSASAVASASSAKENARRKKAKMLAKRAAHDAQWAAEASDHALGSPHSGDPSALYNGSRLQRTVLTAESVWYAPLPNYAAGEEPAHYLPGLSAADKELLFGAVPAATTALAFDPERPAASAAVAADQEQQTETMRRILDLRNSDKEGIHVVNRQRIAEEFGRKTESGGLDTGSSEVQAALLTYKIRNLYEHLHTGLNSRDTANRRNLRLLVHKRARVLKYFKRQDEVAYDELLKDLGLTRRAVEGEIKMGM